MTQATFTNGHALLIGAGADLPVSVKDATTLHGILTDPNRAAYPTGQVDLRTEAGAQRHLVREGFERLIERTNHNPEGTVIVYFSGHGYRVERLSLPTEHYLLPNGYNLSDLAGTALQL